MYYRVYKPCLPASLPASRKTALSVWAPLSISFLSQQWQSAEDFGERRRIRARMYRLREQRLREMVQNDEESLGSLAATEQPDEETEVRRGKSANFQNENCK